MAKELEEYNRKRDFKKTAEPEGKVINAENELRFVVQRHIARKDHYDFRLEWNGALLSWAVPKGPSYNPNEKRLAVRVEDHPLDYRNFEGTIPKGEYGGGVVMLFDEGFWKPYGDVDSGLESGALKFEIYGKRLIGSWALIRMDTSSEANENWLLIKEKDDYARSDDGVESYTTSIRSGRTLAEIESGKDKTFKKNPFFKTEVQLAKLADKVPEGKEWLYEVKYDGYRIIAYVENNAARLVSRNGGDYTNHFKDIAASLVSLASGKAMVLDGEVVIADESGRTDFQALQNYMKNANGKGLTYAVFDILALDGEDLRDKQLIERKSILESVLNADFKNLYYSPYVKNRGLESFTAACKAGMEGIVAKRENSAYVGGRSSDWIKLKCDNRQEFVIGGYTQSDKRTRGVSSIILGIYEGSELIYVGRAGTGFTEREANGLEKKFGEYHRGNSPFANKVDHRKDEKIFWLEPALAAEIKFAEWTEENLLRQASYKGLRTDKDVREIKREKADDTQISFEEINMVEVNDNQAAEIKITHPDKIIYSAPTVTKAEVIGYYQKVASRMLPYIEKRILSIVRCPKGVYEACFYKKHPGTSGGKGIITYPITNSEGKTEDYFYIESSEGLLSEAQMGSLEFHTWGSTVQNIDKPDIMVFDLDPDEGMQLDSVRRGVRDLKSLLDELSLPSFLKTSGGKGYHVVVPFKPSSSWGDFGDFARRIAEVMEQKWPDRYTSNVRKIKRTGKIFIDWIRNGRGATSVAPYSLRARPGAKVSMPITWKELMQIAPDGVDMEAALRRIKEPDPWENFFRAFSSAPVPAL